MNKKKWLLLSVCYLCLQGYAFASNNDPDFNPCKHTFWWLFGNCGNRDGGLNLLVTGTPVSNPPADPPPAFSDTKIAGTSFTLYLTAYHSDNSNNSNNSGIATGYTGPMTLRFYTTYVNPTTGTLNASVNGIAIASSASAPQTTQVITFHDGVATITVTYNDVGMLLLQVADTATDPAGPAGASGNFVIKPARFAMNVPGNSASQTTIPANTAETACLADTVFAKAGNPFSVNVQAQNALGVVTPNYGNETSPQGILLSSSALVAPTGGRNGSTNNGIIGNGTAFSKITLGSVPIGSGWSLPFFKGTTFYFDEVGCIQLTASVPGGNYLGVANGAVVGSQVVGRFIPDHFNASGNTPVFKTACSTSGTSGLGSFTYLNQPFFYETQPVLTVGAYASTGVPNTPTQNYRGSFWKLTSSGFGSIYNKAYFPVNSGDTIPNLNLSATVPTPTFSDGGNGSSTFSFSNGEGLTIQKLSATLAPAFRAEIQLRISNITDSDGVACTGAGCILGGFAFGTTNAGGGITFSGAGGGKQFYHGQLIVVNSIGSELSALTVPMQTQFYTSAGGFVLNTLDTGSSGNCTAYRGGAANLILTPSAGLITTASLEGSPNYYFQQGNLNISLSAPTGTTTGSVEIEANLNTTGANLPWLQSNWPYAGGSSTDFSSNPRGLASFGIFKGNDRVIYEKEITH